MAIVQTGTTQFTGTGGSNAATGTFFDFIDVPADAEFAVVGVVGYTGTSGGFDSILMPKGGVDTAMSKVATGADADGGKWQAALFTMVAPDTGDDKLLKWSWLSSTGENPKIVVTFWKGIDTAAPVRDADGLQQGGYPMTTASMTAASGDLMLAVFGGYTGGSNGTVSAWSNASTLAEMTTSDVTDISIGSGSPSASTTVAVTSVSGGYTVYTALAAVVVRPVGASGVDALADVSGQSLTVSQGHAVAHIGPFVASAVYEDHAVDMTVKNDDETYTFPLTLSSTAGQERLVILAGAADPAATWDFDHVTIDGVVAERVGVVSRGNDVGGSSSMITAYRAPATASTAIDVVATVHCPPSRNVAIGACALFRLTDASAVLRDQATDGRGAPLLDLFTSDDGSVVAGLFGVSTSAPEASWTGLTERLDVSTDPGTSSGHFSVASDDVATGELPRSISATTNDLGTEFDSIASACFSFAPADQPMGSIRTTGQGVTAAAGSVTAAGVRNPFLIETGSTYYVTAILGEGDSVTIDTHADFFGIRPPGYDNWYGADVSESASQASN